jgi:thiol-disulfide isomerase/thioredoxin
MDKVLKTLLIFFVTTISFARSGSVEVSGSVTNYNGSTLTVTDFNNRELASAIFDEQFNFKMNIEEEPGYYLLNYGRESAYIYVNSDDNLNIKFDALHFENTLIFLGKGSERNNYLLRKSLNFNELTKDVNAFYKVDETTFLKNIENVKNTSLKLLDTYEVEEYFIEEEKKSLEYEKLLSVQNFESSYKFYLGEDIKASQKFYTTLESIDLNDDRDYLKQPYYRYLVNSIWSKRISEENNVDDMLNVLRKVKSEAVLISLVNGFYSKISSEKERGQDYFKLIKIIAGSNKGFVDAARKKLKETEASKGLVSGERSPSFNYINIQGTKVSLDDFKGKYVYIDIWATWCAPCIKQIPYLKKLEDRYHDKNIAFVSISVDKPEVIDKWRKVILDRKLGGTQLFADKSFDSAFMKAYGISSIPRFIVLDTEGNIVDAEAPRPSFEKTITLLDSFIK